MPWPRVQAPYTVTVSGRYKAVLNASGAEVSGKMTEGTAEFAVKSSEMNLIAASGNSANLSFTVNASSQVSPAIHMILQQQPCYMLGLCVGPLTGP
jgi:hypothetical protein